MPCRYGASPEHRIRVELVEADLEIGFHLVDLAECNPDQSCRLLANAEQAYHEILGRIKRLPPPEEKIFEPLVAELRRAIDLRQPLR